MARPDGTGKGAIRAGSNSPLTERGIAQASAIGRLLVSLPDAADRTIVASPLGRARRTAEIIRDQLRGIGSLRVDERLRELTMGSWDGLTFNQIEAISPGIFEREGPEWCFCFAGWRKLHRFRRARRRVARRAG